MAKFRYWQMFFKNGEEIFLMRMEIYSFAFTYFAEVHFKGLELWRT